MMMMCSQPEYEMSEVRRARRYIDVINIMIDVIEANTDLMSWIYTMRNSQNYKKIYEFTRFGKKNQKPKQTQIA